MLSACVYRSGAETVLAVCDEELLGRTFRQGRLRVEVTDFYDGERIREDALPAMLSAATNINLVGERSVGIAVEKGLVDASAVMRVEGIPCAMVFCV